MRKVRTLFLILAAACTAAGPPDPAPDNSNKSGSVAPGTQDSDWKAIEGLEAQAKSIAKSTGCSSAAGCRTAPVGSRACGGPRYYIAYCSVTTDSAALFAKLDEVAKSEQAFNRKYGIASTCEFRMPPATELSGGSCVAK